MESYTTIQNNLEYNKSPKSSQTSSNSKRLCFVVPIDWSRDPMATKEGSATISTQHCLSQCPVFLG